MGMILSFVLAALVLLYAGWVLHRMLRGIRSGKGSSCLERSCLECGGCQKGFFRETGEESAACEENGDSACMR